MTLPSNETPAWKHLGLLLAACLFLWVPTCGLWDLSGPDEGRYVQVAKELLGRSNWFYLTVHGDPYDQKPPLPFWMFAAMLKITGSISSWAVRMPSVLMTTLSVLCVYVMARRTFNARAGLIAGFVMLATPAFMENAPTAELDGIFAGFVTLSLVPWVTRRQGEPLPWASAFVMWTASILAFFVKGPVAQIILLATILGEARLERSWKPFWQSRAPLGLLYFGLAVAGWFYAQKLAAGGAFVKEQVSEQTWQRFFKGDHAEPPWYYLPRLLGVMFIPWSLFLVPIARELWDKRRDLPRELRPYVCWFLIPFVFFCIATGKRQAYLLPIMPPLAVLVGWFLDRSLRDNVPMPRLSKALGGLAVAMGLVLGGFAAAMMAKGYEIGDFRFSGFKAAITAGLGAATLLVGALMLLKPRRGTEMIAAGVLAVVLQGLLTFVVFRPAANHQKSTREFAFNLKERFNEVPGDRVLGALGRAEKAEYHVYGNYAVKRLGNEPAELPPPAKLPGLLLVRNEEDFKALSPFLNRAGFEEVWRGVVSDDDLYLFQRTGNPPPAR